MNLDELLKYVKGNIPYYRSIESKSSTEISIFPIVDKMTYAKNYCDFFRKYAERDTLKKFTTSGSTGTPLIIYKSESDYIAQLKCLWKLRYRLYGIKTSDRNVGFVADNGQKPEINFENNKMLVPIDFIGNHQNEIIEKMLSFQPRYIIGYPSILIYFAHSLAKQKLQLPECVSYIESMGEWISDVQRVEIQKQLGVPVTNFYGCTEIFGIAYACSEGRMHVLDDNVFVEVLQSNGKVGKYDVEGRIIVTGLNCKEQVFVRYNLNDIGVLRKGGDCPCGCMADYIELRRARRYSSVKLSEDTYIHSSYLYGVIDSINYQMAGCIVWFKYFQHSIKQLTLYMQLKRGYEIFAPKINKIIVAQLCEVFRNNTKIDIMYVDDYRKVTQNCKYQFIESKLE